MGAMRAGCGSPLTPRSAAANTAPMMDNVWLASALWIALALASSLISIRLALSVALIEIMVGAILLTFPAGGEVDIDVVRRNVGASIGIGLVSFLFPYLGCMLAARYLLDW